MAGWSILTNGSSSKGSPVKKKCVDSGSDKLRYLFDQVISIYLKRVCVDSRNRPIPALLGDGRSVDLFRLFWVVRENGGFDLVSKNGLWGFVAEELGLDEVVKSALKLIYVKYVYVLDKWLKRKLSDEKCFEIDGNLRFLCSQLENELKISLSSSKVGKVKDGKKIRYGSQKNGEYIELGSEERNVSFVKILISNDDDKKGDHDNGNDVDDDEAVDLGHSVEERFFSRKRKQESFSGMLSWLRQIATNPCDLTMGKVPEAPKWKEQALKVQEALLQKGNFCLNTHQSPLQLRIHPSMYEERIFLSNQSTERCSKRVPLIKSPTCPCCKPCLITTKVEPENCSPKAPDNCLNYECSNGDHPAAVDLMEPVNQFKDNTPKKQVPVGPMFQAIVPDWTGVLVESYSKWVGTRVWPPENGEHNTSVGKSCIGKGREESCQCRFPGSVECIRFHIAEKRMILKHDLGMVFYQWRFDCMGEEVSLSWTSEEEKRFKNIIRLNPSSLNKCFQNTSFKIFRKKTRKDLVSYYFNVFVVQRRRYQNRVTPKEIDSDDDESEFGSLSEGFGKEAVKVPGSDSRTGLLPPLKKPMLLDAPFRGEGAPEQHCTEKINIEDASSSDFLRKDDVNPQVRTCKNSFHNLLAGSFSGILLAAIANNGMGTAAGANHPLAKTILVARLCGPSA
ncbi:ARID DNA-binding domain [Dillenia turbinata]|uniref:ARID DNA-binding domain n=1 Tax=Dillenia turbinata TaxID=194707 RepID=A0AAN8WKG0_9MAGN